eukprot:gene742-1423_t
MRALRTFRSNKTIRYLQVLHRSDLLFNKNILNRPRCRIIDNYLRAFSTDKESFKETLKRVQEKYQEENSKHEDDDKGKTEERTVENNESSSFRNIYNRVSAGTFQAYDIIMENFTIAYAEMTGEAKSSTLEKKVRQADSYRKAASTTSSDDDVNNKDEESDVESSGPNAIVLVKEPTSAWEQMKSRLNDSPFIREILKKSKQFGAAASKTDVGQAAQKIGQNVKDKIEDVREFWATSQNPLVYSVSGIIDNLTSETEEGVALKEIMKLDPTFVMEDWTEEVRNNLAPIVLKAHIRGDAAALKPWLGEAVYNKLSTDIRLRKADGISFDPNILDIEENRVIVRFVDGEGPIILVVYMVQQINCIRNKAGEITEGGENEIRAKFYTMAFKQQYLEEENIVKWKVVDYEFAGDIPYL